MRTKLLTLLKNEYLVSEWLNTPINEWSGFTVTDMLDYGFYVRVNEWFSNLSDEQILEIKKKDYLCLQSLHSS